MEPKYSIELFPQGGGFETRVYREQQKPNGSYYPPELWQVWIGPDFDLDAPLRCKWEGDTEITQISLSEMFPAEYEYLKAKLQA